MYSLQQSILKPEPNFEDFQQEPYYKAEEQPRWLLIPGSDNGVLLGSRNMTYAQQVTYMEENYPGFHVGTVRELITVALLKMVQDKTVLFPKNDPLTFGRCQERYQQNTWQGRGIRVGSNKKDERGVIDGLVFSCFGEHDHNQSEGLFCCFSA